MSKYKFIQDKEFLKARENKKFFHFGKLNLPRVEWADVISQIDLCTTNNLPLQTTNNFGMVLYTGNNIAYIDEVCKYIGKLDTLVDCSAHLYISFSSVSKTFGRHKDTSDVFFWQGIGSTKWIIEDYDITRTFNLQEKEMIYIPRQMYHNIIPLSPRVGISIGLDYQ